MIRILHVIGSMNCGGAETMIMNIYRAIDRRQIQFDFVIHTNDKCFYEDEIEKLGGKIYRTQKYLMHNLFSYKKWWAEFFENHSEHSIIHGHIGSSAWVYLSVAKKYGKITVAHSHNACLKSKTVKDLLWKMNALPVRFVAEYFIACSPLAGETRFGKKVMRSGKCMILKNGIDAKKYRFNETMRSLIREKNGVKDKLVIGHVGRFSYLKNHEFLIKVFEVIHKKCPNSVLWLLGTGEDFDNIVNMAKERNLEDSVRFIGVVSNTYEYLQGMDVFVFPSRSEGLPLSVVEAQAAGLPIVTSMAVPREADIGSNLMCWLDLSEGPEMWGEIILKQKSRKHIDTLQNVIDSGFDIFSSKLDLEEFYFVVLQKHAETNKI